MRNFGHKGQEDFWGLGINGKNCEFHAAMGLCILPKIKEIITNRKHLSELYTTYLTQSNLPILFPTTTEDLLYNYAYYPVLFEDEQQLLSVRDSLNAHYIYPRRYFYPSLHHLPYVQQGREMPVSESISKRVLCLPLFSGLEDDSVRRICNVIADVLIHSS